MTDLDSSQNTQPADQPLLTQTQSSPPPPTQPSPPTPPYLPPLPKPKWTRFLHLQHPKITLPLDRLIVDHLPRHADAGRTSNHSNHLITDLQTHTKVRRLHDSEHHNNTKSSKGVYYPSTKFFPDPYVRTPFVRDVKGGGIVLRGVPSVSRAGGIVRNREGVEVVHPRPETRVEEGGKRVKKLQVGWKEEVGWVPIEGRLRAEEIGRVEIRDWSGCYTSGDKEIASRIVGTNYIPVLPSLSTVSRYPISIVRADSQNHREQDRARCRRIEFENKRQHGRNVEVKKRHEIALMEEGVHHVLANDIVHAGDRVKGVVR